MLHAPHILIPRGEECKLDFMTYVLKGAIHLGFIGVYNNNNNYYYYYYYYYYYLQLGCYPVAVDILHVNKT